MTNTDGVNVRRVNEGQMTRSDLYDEVAQKAATDPDKNVKISASRMGKNKSLIQLQPQQDKQTYHNNKNNLQVLINHLSMSPDDKKEINARVAKLQSLAPMNWSALKEILTVTEGNPAHDEASATATETSEEESEFSEEQKVPSTLPPGSARNPTWDDLKAFDSRHKERGKKLKETTSALTPGREIDHRGVSVTYRAEVLSSFPGEEVDIDKTKTSGDPLFTRSLMSCTALIAIAENEASEKKAVLCHANSFGSVQKFFEKTNKLRSQGYTINALLTTPKRDGNFRHWMFAALVDRYADLIDSNHHTLKIDAENPLNAAVDLVAGTVVVSHDG